MHVIAPVSPMATSARLFRSHVAVAAVLAAAGGVAAALEVPYELALSPVPLHGAMLVVVAVVSAGMYGAVSFLMAWGGLAMGAPLDLDAPLLRGRGRARLGRSLAVSAAAGMALAGLVLLALRFFPMPAPATMPHPTWWQGGLASVGAGVLEEIEMRLFLMTLVAFAIFKVTKRRGTPVFVVASLVAALLFGAGHLPLAHTVFGSLTPRIVVGVVAPNAALGFVFGLFYKKWGLEHAMLAHFAADLVLHVMTAV